MLSFTFPFYDNVFLESSATRVGLYLLYNTILEILRILPLKNVTTFRHLLQTQRL